MNELIQACFDYTALPAESAGRLKIWKVEIAAFTDTVESSLVQIGLRFQKAQDELNQQGVKGDGFVSWIESETKYSRSSAYNLINVADRFKDQPFPNFGKSVIYALAAPSTPESVVTQAIEHAESGEKVTIADVKKWKQRAEESQKESNERRKKIRDLEYQVDLLKAAQPADNERIIEKEVIPPDYEAAKQKAAALEGELKALKADQQKIVDSQVQAKLRGYQSELDELERKKAQLDDMVARKQAYMESLSSDVKRIETHRSVIDGIRLELIGLAAFLSDMEDMRDLDTIRRWQALGCMLQEAKSGIDALFPAKPRLEVINHV